MDDVWVGYWYIVQVVFCLPYFGIDVSIVGTVGLIVNRLKVGRAKTLGEVPNEILQGRWVIWLLVMLIGFSIILFTLIFLFA